MLPAPQRTNILAEILCTTEEQTAEIEQQELANILSLYTITSTKKPRKQKRSAAKPRKKKKVTAYFSKEILDGLEKVRNELLLLFPERKKNTFSRSNLLDTTVSLLLKEFTANKTHEDLLDALLSKNNRQSQLK